MANESTIASRSLLPTYESLYGEEGKFPVDPDTVARLRAEAEEQGLIFVVMRPREKNSLSS